MRWQIKTMIVVVAALIGLNLATSQAQITIGGGFGGGLGGLFDKGARPDPLQLVRNASVKKELKLTEDDLNKVDMAVWEALAKALKPDQFKRLKEIDLQQRDYQAFGDISVQDSLKLSKEQKDSMKTILADSDKELSNLMKELTGGAGGFGAFTGLQDKVANIRKETKDRCTDVLSPQQRRTWMEMVGDDFKLETPKLNIPAFDLKDLKKGAKKKGGGD